MKFRFLTLSDILRKNIGLPDVNTIDICITSISDFSLMSEHLPILSDAEQRHSQSLRSEKHQLCFLLSRILLRTILSSYLHCPEEELIFEKEIHGKPYVHSLGKTVPPVHFNISHSEDYVALAFSLHSPVGIDIEHTRSHMKIESLVKRFFHPDEYPELKEWESHALPPQDFLLRRWTVREAFLKGLGSGLTISPSSFYVSELAAAIPSAGDGSAAPSFLYGIKKSQKDYSSWQIASVPAPDGYYCSVAYKRLLHS